MAASFDPADYLRAPIITVSSGITLARGLVDACPAGAPENVKRARKKLKDVAQKAEDDLAERNRRMGVYTEDDSRALDNEADRAWGGLRMRCEAMAMLDGDEYPRARRAAKLGAALFGEGSEFLKADYASQSAAMSAILRLIEQDDLDGEIRDIAGDEFLSAIRAVQPRYEAMVKERLRRDSATGQSLVETMRSLQAAIVNYASKILSTIEMDDDESTEVVRVALLPIANFREAWRRGSPKAADAAGSAPEGSPPADPS